MNTFKVRHLSAWVVAAGLGFVSLPAAADLFSFPAGLACDFELQIETIGGNTHYKEFFDKNGNLVRTLTAGKGWDLVFTNLGTSATFSLKGNGSVAHTTLNSDGSSTVVTTGHFVIIFFPTDVPAGPSTTQYVGRVVYTADSSSNFTLQSVSGESTDICAALS